MQVSKPLVLSVFGALAVLAAGGFLLADQFHAPVKEPLTLIAPKTGQSAKAVEPEPAPVKLQEAAQSRAPEEPPKPSAQAAPSAVAEVESKEPASSPAPTAGSLGRLTALRAELDEERVKVLIEEQRSKLSALRTPSIPSLQAALAVPAAKQSALPQIAPASPAKQDQRPRVVSVSGAAGNLTATVQTAAGEHRVRVGDALDGGRVEAISRDGVTVRQGASSRMILFKE